MEGVQKLCDIAESQFEKIDPAKKYKIWQGLYENTFDQALASIKNLDCAFIDGNHQYDPTMEYFGKLYQLIENQGLLIFDDINWNEGMQKAWSEIKSSNKIAFSIDLYEIGIAIVDKAYQGPRESFSFHYDY